MEEGACAVTTALMCVLAALSALWVLRRKHQQRLFRRYGIPGPEPSLFFGNWKQLKEDRLKIMDDWIREYGKVFGFYEGEVPKVVISDLDMIKECFVKQAHIFRDRMPLLIEVEPINSSLLALQGNEWKRVRTILNPSFSVAKMKLMSQVMNACGNTLVKVISEHISAERSVVNITKLSQGLSMDVITKCALAWQVDCQDNPRDPILQSIQKVFLDVDQAMIASAVAIPILRKVYARIFPLLSYGKLFRKITENLHMLITLRRADENRRLAMDVLQLLLEAEKEVADPDSSKVGITDRQLVANCFVFLAAGFETTATTLAFVLYELARHPEEQDNLFHELMGQSSGGSGPLGYDDLHKLKRMDAVIMECLRLYPPIVLFTARVCSCDTKLSGYSLPAGAHVILPTWHILHNPEIWADPYAFNPSRFMPGHEEEERRHPAAYVPFGLGPRECIGRRFAMLELKTVLAKLVANYVLSTCDETEIPVKLTVPVVTVNPAEDIQLRFTRRNS